MKVKIQELKDLLKEALFTNRKKLKLTHIIIHFTTER